MVFTNYFFRETLKCDVKLRIHKAQLKACIFNAVTIVNS